MGTAGGAGAEGGQPGGRPGQEDHRPHGGAQRPDPGEVAGVDQEGLGRWSSQLPARRGFVAARGPGRLISRPPARPRTSVSSGRRAGHARRSRRRRQCRESRRLGRRPDPLAERLPSPPAAGQSRPYPPRASRRLRRRLSPAPPPTQPDWKGRVGAGGEGPLPTHILRPCPAPSPARLVILGNGVQRALRRQESLARGTTTPRRQRASPRACGLCSPVGTRGVYSAGGEGDGRFPLP